MIREKLKFYINKWIFRRCLLFTLLFVITFCCIKFNFHSRFISFQDGKNSLINFRNFKYIIKNDICSEETFLVILIHSAPNHFHHRNLIRSTWGNPGITFLTINVVFLLAVAPEFQEDIKEENKQYKDIIQGNFVDSYHNLTYKHIMGLKWASENCRQAKYLMKMDDDIFMNIYQFLKYINKHFTPFKLQTNIACFKQSGMPVVRDPVSKWYVSKAEYTSDVFENYCSGWAYLTTINAAHLLVRTVNKLKYFWVDDVFVTGTAAKIANISHIKINDLYDLESGGLIDWSNNSDKTMWNKVFAPTWGDLVLSRKAYRKTLTCWVKGCKCCYIRKTTPIPTQTTTRRKGIAKLLPIF